MAGIDYCSCEECGTRLFYDGERFARGYMEEAGSATYLICSHCHKKLLKKIEKLEKQGKRGR